MEPKMKTEHASIAASRQSTTASAPARRLTRGVALSVLLASALSGCSTVDWLTNLGSPQQETYATASIPTARQQAPIQTGVAAWDGDISAPGMSAAHPTLMPGSWARVTNVATGQAAVVRVTRTMTPIRGRDMELSRDAAAAIGALQQGVANVLIEPIDPRQANPSEVAWSQPAPAPAPVTPAPMPQAIPTRPAPAQTARFEPRRVDGYDPDLATASIPGPNVAYRPQQAQPVPRVSGATYGTHYLQLGSFRDRLNAERLAASLGQQNLGGGMYGDAFVETAYVDGAVFHRVRLGPIQNSNVAQRALQDARSMGHNGARILKP